MKWNVNGPLSLYIYMYCRNYEEVSFICSSFRNTKWELVSGNWLLFLKYISTGFVFIITLSTARLTRLWAYYIVTFSILSTRVLVQDSLTSPNQWYYEFSYAPNCPSCELFLGASTYISHRSNLNIERELACTLRPNVCWQVFYFLRFTPA